MRFPTPDYFAVLAAKRRTVTLRLVDGEVEVRRARLRLFAELEHVAAGEAEPEAKALAYIEAASGVEVDQIEPDQLLRAYADLLDLNKSVSVPAILRVQADGAARTPSAFLYAGRWLAALVESLVEAGWDPEYVLEQMDPDEAWLYMQEANYNEHQRYQQAYSLSTVGREGKQGKQRKMQPPAWTFTGYGEPRQGKKKPGAGVSGVILDFNDPDTVAGIRARMG